MTNCDRDICIKNEYNGIGCGECEVTKSSDASKELDTCKDTQFVPIELEFRGRKGSGFLYKSQQMIVTEYIPLEVFEHLGGKYKEK